MMSHGEYVLIGH